MRTEFIADEDGLRDVRYIADDEPLSGRSLMLALILVAMVMIGAGAYWLRQLCRGL